MERYFGLIRRLLRADAPVAEANGADGPADIYRVLVRLQHRQVLMQLFTPIRTLIGESDFEQLVERVRRTCPPRNANPAGWATTVAAMLEADTESDGLTRALATFAAMRCEAQLAEDAPWTTGLRPHAALAAFACDPRLGPAARATMRPCVLAIFRDDEGRVRAPALSPEAVAAWGLSAGETDRAFLASVGMDEAAIARGHQQLRALGLWRARGTP
jgi:hypothetical protein